MALTIELKPGERFILGNCVITNGHQRTRLTIDGEAPVLREKDIMTVQAADTPAKRVYLAVQLMYLTQDIGKLQAEFFAYVQDLVKAVPSALPYVAEIGNHILTGFYYKALREAKALITHEEEILGHAPASGARLQPNGAGDSQPT